MIYNTNQDAQGPYRSMPIKYPLIPKLNRPSSPKHVEALLPKLVSEFKSKTKEFLAKYPWLDDSSTIVNTTLNSTTYTNAEKGEAVFASFDIGNYDTLKGIWSWAWAESDYDNSVEFPSLALRNYGYTKKIEVLTKPKWQASNEEKIEILAFAFKLHYGIGIEVKLIDSIEYFRLLKEK